MTKPVLGLLIGAGLGLIDGLSAWLDPEARPILLGIVVGSTLKGVVTGLAAGFIARRWRSMAVGILSGLAIGFVLSSLAAIGQPSHYAEIVLPGMLVGAIVGFVTQRYPATLSSHRSAGRVACVMLAFVACGLGVAAWQDSPPDAKPDRLVQLAPLLGRWAGTTEGQPGKGTVEREYVRILGTRFIQVRNRSTYPPQVKNPKGEVHEDMGVFSFDSARKTIVLRQFHTEGFVNQYVLDPGSTPNRLMFTTERIENIPAGWRARETNILSGTEQLEELFELAEPGKDFEPYSRNRLTRATSH